jgi:hypothetical protein
VAEEVELPTVYVPDTFVDEIEGMAMSFNFNEI